MVPVAKVGYRTETEYIYNKLGISMSGNTKSTWIHTAKYDNAVKMAEVDVPENAVPNVIGMGLQDAIIYWRMLD